VPTTELPEPLREILAKPNLAVMTTLKPDGQPVSVATWYLMDGDGFLVNLDHTRKRIEYLRRDRRVALIVLDGDDPRGYISVQGSASAIRDDLDLADADRLWKQYVGDSYPDRTHKRVSVHIQVDRWHAWGAAKSTIET
jgi:PPOX class probable F420-dependent enzyme